MADIKDPIKLLEQAENSLRLVDHMVYITYPLIKENRLLQKIIEQLGEIAENIVKAALFYEYIYKRIQIPTSQEHYFNLFKAKCTNSFEINTTETSLMEELFDLIEKHKNSPLEFSRKDKLVIMSNGLRAEAINIERLKKYLNVLKIVLHKTKTKITKH